VILGQYARIRLSPVGTWPTETPKRRYARGWLLSREGSIHLLPL